MWASASWAQTWVNVGVSNTISLEKSASFFILFHSMALAIEMNALQNNF